MLIFRADILRNIQPGLIPVIQVQFIRMGLSLIVNIGIGNDFLVAFVRMDPR